MVPGHGDPSCRSRMHTPLVSYGVPDTVHEMYGVESTPPVSSGVR